MRRPVFLACAAMVGCVYVDRPVIRGPVTIVGATGASARAATVFVSARDSADRWSSAQIYLADATGQIVTNITNDAHSHCSPSLSPDGSRLVFVSSRDAGTQLYSMGVDGSDVRQLTTRSGSINHPRWSAARQIAFDASASNARGSSVWLMDEDGSDQAELTTPAPSESDDGGLAFVDQGRSIVFARYDEKTHDRDLYVVPTDGSSAPAQLTHTPKTTETLPVASHDGRLLAYRATTMAESTTESIVVLAVGTWTTVREIPLPPPARYNISGIDFTADDRGFVFGADASDVGGSLQNLHGELFSIDLDATRLVRLTKNAAYDGAPVSLLLPAALQ